MSTPASYPLPRSEYRIAEFVACPFAKGPTFRRFVEKVVAEYGCELKTWGKLVGSRGATEIKYLKRWDGETDYLSETLPADLDDYMSTDSERRLIRQLELPETIGTGMESHQT